MRVYYAVSVERRKRGGKLFED